MWGGKLMWNQTPLLLQRAQGLPDRSGAGLLAAIRDVIGTDPVLVHVYRPDVVSQAVSFWRAVQTRVWRGRPDPVRDSRAEYHAGAIAHVVAMLRNQEEGWRKWFAEEGIEPIDVSYPVLWRNLTQIVGDVLEAIGRIAAWRRTRCWSGKPTSAPTSGSSATGPMRSDWASRSSHPAPYIGAFAGTNTPELSASSSARITCTTALINARWVNACGKLPRCRPVRGSISSA